MRKHGSGSISVEGGRFRARLSTEAGRVPLGTFDSEAEAQAVLDAARLQLRDLRVADGVTLRTWGERVLDARERDGLRGIVADRGRWRVHIEQHRIADLPVRSISRGDVLAWLDTMRSKRAADRRGRRKLGRQTVQNALNLLRAVLEDAAHRCGIPNPARDVRLPRDTGRTEDPWTFLSPDEQVRLLKAVPSDRWALVAFALGTGLRQGEQWALRLEDVHVDDRPRVVVRYGAPNKPTKSGKPRTVPLFGLGLEAARRAVQEARAAKRNPKRLLFPSVRGNARQKGAPPGWETWQEIAELGRSLRWHDLRHTCASALVAGWWGRTWSLEEVRAMLGHSTIKVTERYAHLAGSLVERAAEATQAALLTAEPTDRRLPVESLETSSVVALSPRNPCQSHLRGLNSRPTVYETENISSDFNDIVPNSARDRAVKALELAVAGDPMAWPALVRVAREVVAAVDSQGDRCPASLTGRRPTQPARIRAGRRA